MPGAAPRAPLSAVVGWALDWVMSSDSSARGRSLSIDRPRVARGRGSVAAAGRGSRLPQSLLRGSYRNPSATCPQPNGPGVSRECQVAGAIARLAPFTNTGRTRCAGRASVREFRTRYYRELVGGREAGVRDASQGTTDHPGWYSARGRRSGLVERLLKVGDQVVDMLDADGQADQGGIHLEMRAGDRGVGHRRRDFDERLDAAERLREREEARRLGDGDRAVVGGARTGGARQERDHPTAGTHLASVANEGGTGMGVGAFPETRVEDPLDVVTAGEEPGHGLGVRHVALDAEVQCPQPTQDQEAVERARHAAHRVLEEPQPLG